MKSLVVILLFVFCSLAVAKQRGIPGLVFSDFDQLYTKLLSNDSIPETLKPDTVTTLQNVTDYIHAIDYKAIVKIQNYTSEIFRRKAAVEEFIKRHSNAFKKECRDDIEKKYKTYLADFNNTNSNCKARLENLLVHFDVEVEHLINTCMQLQPLKSKQRFMRAYADFYIDLEKMYEMCKADGKTKKCIKKGRFDEFEKTIKKIFEELIEKMEDYKRFVPYCCSYLTHYVTYTDANSFC